MKFPFKNLVTPALIILQSVLIIGFILVYLQKSSRMDKLMQDAILCDFYVQVSEWQSGHEEFISPGLSVQNEQGALRVYNRVIMEESGFCEEGLCLDSAKVTLYQSCPDATEVLVLRDTLIRF